MTYQLDDIRARVVESANDYNQNAEPAEQVVCITLFGSYARGAENNESDIDLTVTFASNSVGLFALARLLMALEDRFEVPVDMVQKPLPADALIDIENEVPLYEAA